MNIAVCDDLPEYREKLKTLLNPYISANQLNIAEFCRGEDLLDACEKGVLPALLQGKGLRIWCVLL